LEVADTVYSGTADETKFSATFLPVFVGWEVNTGDAAIVKCKVTTLSQPLTFVNVCVGVADVV
jgi:hypothetical protein